MSAHVILADGADAARTLDALCECPSDDFDIEHSTFQLETVDRRRIEETEPRMTHHVELLRFSDCPNHPVARQMLVDAIERLAPGTKIEEVDASDPDVAAAQRFPGLADDPRRRDRHRARFADPGDYTPRCRLYWTAAGLRGIPDPAWIEEALGAVTTVAIGARSCWLAPCASNT